MFYRFSSAAGRLIPSTQACAYIPQGLAPVVVESAPSVFSSAKVAAAKEPPALMKSMSTTADVSSTPKGLTPTEPGYKKIIEQQEWYSKFHGNVYNSKPSDKAGYYIVALYSTLLVGFSLKNVFDMTFKKKE